MSDTQVSVPVTPAPSNAAVQPMNPSDVPQAPDMPGLPSIADIARAFKGKSMHTDFFTKPNDDAAIAPKDAPKTAAVDQAAVHETPTEPADDTTTEPVVAPTVDVEPTAEPGPDDAPSDSKGRQFAALSRRERELKAKTDAQAQAVRQTEARLTEMEQRLNSRMAELEKREQQFANAKRPLDVLKARGFTYEDVTQDVVGGYKVAEPDPVETKLSPIAAELAELRAKFAAQQAESDAEKNHRNLSTVNNNISKTLSEKPERYEFVNALGENKIDIVRETMVSWYNANGTYLPYDEACDHVEEFYTKQFEQLQKTSKAAKTVGKPAQPVAAPQQAQPKAVKIPAKTLTNNITSGGKSATNVDDMPKRDALAHLAKQLKFL